MSKKQDVSENFMYIAKARSIMKTENGKITKVSKPLGLFLVKPIKSKLPGSKNIVGYREVITGKKIISSKIGFYDDFTDITIYREYLDSISKNNIGGIAWEIIDKAPAQALMDKKDIEAYLSKGENTIINDLLYARLDAARIAEERVLRKKSKRKVKCSGAGKEI